MQKRWALMSIAGLSPLARGTLLQKVDAIKRVRFIPAGAGNTPVPKTWPWEKAVYPRWRGEHCHPATPFLVVAGLSPLARGTRANKLAKLEELRFIPAGAGNT